MIVDGHSDFIERILSERAACLPGALQREYVPDLRTGGVRLAIMQVGSDTADQTEHEAMAASLQRISVLTQEIAAAPDTMSVQARQDLAELMAGDRIGIVYMLEGGKAFLDSADYVAIFHQLGVRMATLTWNNCNRLACGCGQGAAAAGLTSPGVDVVREMGRLGMILDLSHLADRGVAEALAIATGPVVASHANARGRCDHERNLSDDTIRAIGERGGIVGINFFPRFLDRTARPTADDVVAHIDYIINLAGEDAVGLGPDFIDYSQESMGQALLQSTVDYGTDFAYPVDLESTKDLSRLPKLLTAAGHPAARIEKVLGGNWLRVLSEALP